MISTNTRPCLSSEAAGRLLVAALAEATRQHRSVSVAVVDDAGNLLAFQRMDGSVLASVESAQTKAFTAILAQAETTQLVAQAQPGAPLFNVAAAFGRPIATIPGGVPLLRAGQAIGAIGVGGCPSSEDDHAIARAAAALL